VRITLIRRPFSRRTLTGAGLLAICLWLAGCASGSNPFSPEVAYRCDNGLTLLLNPKDDSIALQGGRGTQLLLRDAGGVGNQAVYSNPEVRLTTGLGADGRGAQLEGLVPNNRARCVRS
jgi:hypothetical protein